MTAEQTLAEAATISDEITTQSTIDSRAHIHPSAKIGENVAIGPWCSIGPHVEIGDGTIIDSHVVIHSNTKIGKHNRVHAFVALGGDPQDVHYHGEPTYLEIGDENIFREFITINRGSTSGIGVTKIGNKNFFLAYSHIAHDCIVGNHVYMFNNATLAGHVQVDDFAIIGAFSAVHQFCRVGAHSFLSRAGMTGVDIVPYITAVGPGKCVATGLNLVGLKRRGFSNETIKNLKEAYRILYRKNLKLAEARAALLEMSQETPEVKNMIDVIDNAKRGILRKDDESLAD